MQRRDFIATLAGTAAAWPFATYAQQPRKPIVGIVGSGTPSTQGRWTAAFVQRLNELGWIEGRNVQIEIRWAQGRRAAYREIASEYVRLKVDVIVAIGNEAALAAKQVTSAIPIVFPVAGDPIGTGLVVSLAHPGGNVTGLSQQQTDLAGKRVELLREVVPTLRHLSILANIGNPVAVLDMHEVQATARGLGLTVTTLEIGRAEDIAPGINALRGRADALYVCIDALMVSNGVRINELALAARLPTMHGVREFVEAGGLMSYGPNFEQQFRRAGDLVNKILRGAKPADIPVEQPTKFDLAINLRTAKALDLAVPSRLIEIADKVIE